MWCEVTQKRSAESQQQMGGGSPLPVAQKLTLCFSLCPALLLTLIHPGKFSISQSLTLTVYSNLQWPACLLPWLVYNQELPPAWFTSTLIIQVHSSTLPVPTKWYIHAHHSRLQWKCSWPWNTSNLAHFKLLMDPANSVPLYPFYSGHQQTHFLKQNILFWT